MQFHNKPPPPNSLINPLTALLLFNDKPSMSSQKDPLTFTETFPSTGNSVSPFPPSLPYLLVPFLPLLYESGCAPLFPADAAVIEKHTLLRPLSLSLPDSHWLPVRGDITLLVCLPPSLLLCTLPLSLSLSSPHSLWILTIPL